MQKQLTVIEMDIFEKQEMSKHRPRVKEELKDWYDWLVNHVLEPITEKARRAFKTFKDKIMGLYIRRKVKNPKKSKIKNPLTPQSLSKLLIGLIGVIELMEEVEWM